MELVATSSAGLTAHIKYDSDPESPRDWDNASVLLMNHSRYSWPWEDDSYSKDSTLEELRDAILENDPGAYIATVRAYDHSSVSFSAAPIPSYPFDDQWDSGIAGLAFVPSKQMTDNWPTPDSMPADWPQKVIDGDLETYTDYCNGSVYGIVIKDTDGETLDSCWGFYGYSDTETEAKGMLEVENRRYLSEQNKKLETI